MARQERAQPHEAAPAFGPDDVREASTRLPERQREALALHGDERLAYEEIAARIGTSSSSVAQLIARARINLYDELRGTVLASVATPSPDCERALPLIAARDDEQLEAASADVIWLDEHLASCDRCTLAEEQMREADESYRSHLAIGVPGEPSGAPPGLRTAPRRLRLTRGRVMLAGGLAALLLLGGLAAAFVGDDGGAAPASPAADAAPGRGGAGEAEPAARRVKAGRGKRSSAKRKAKAAGTADVNGSGTTTAEATPTPLSVPAQATSGGAPSGSPSQPARPSGKAEVEATKQASAPASAPKPAPPASPPPTSQPASEPAAPPPTEAPPPSEESPDKPGRSGEAPGKPSGRPPR